MASLRMCTTMGLLAKYDTARRVSHDPSEETGHPGMPFDMRPTFAAISPRQAEQDERRDKAVEHLGSGGRSSRCERGEPLAHTRDASEVMRVHAKKKGQGRREKRTGGNPLRTHRILP